jgi:hypothetical protein
VIVFVATDEEIAGLEPLDELGGARIVAPIADPVTDYDFFLEERAPGRLRTLPHAVLDFDPARFGFVPLLATPGEPLGQLFALTDAALEALADSEDRDPPVATLARLARVAAERGARVLARALRE